MFNLDSQFYKKWYKVILLLSSLWAGGSLARIYKSFSRSVSQPVLLVHKILVFHWIVLLWTFQNHLEFLILSLLESILFSFLFSEIWSVFKASSKFMTWLVYVSKTQIPKYSNHSYFFFLFICKILYTRLPEHKHNMGFAQKMVYLRSTWK